MDKINCYYCNEKATTREHVPPRSLFPKPKPSNLLTVPSCSDHNNLFSKDEEYFLASFMFGDAGVSEVGKILWDQKLRRMYKKNKGIKRKISEHLNYIDTYTFNNIYLGKKFIITLDMERINRIITKIIRGLYFYEYSKVMSNNSKIYILFIKNIKDLEVVKPFAKSLIQGGIFHSKIFRYVFNKTESNNSMWLINFYNSYNFWIISYENK